MLLSIIVPVFNVEKYLHQCLDSLVSQSYKNIEVIMVDDGSQDKSGMICDKYAAKYKNFSVIHKENAGLGMARNTGLDHISGDYVTFVDSDDYLEPFFIEKMLNYAVSNNVDMCKGGFQRVRDDGVIIATRQYENEIFNGSDARTKFLPRMFGSSPTKHDSIEMCVCGAIYKKSLIDKYHLRFPSEREMISEDLVFNIDYMQHADGAYLISEVGYNYRANFSSLTKSYRPDRFVASRHFYLEIGKKLRRLGYSEDILKRLDKLFFIYLRACIAQEKRKVSGNNIKEALAHISNICLDETVQEVLSKYPVQYLEIKQRIFIELIRHKLKFLLWFLVEAKII